MNGEKHFLVKLCLTHLLQKNGPEMYCFQCVLEWRNGLVRKHGPEMSHFQCDLKCHGLVITENGPVMSVPVICDGLGQCCCLWCFASGLTLVSVTSLRCSWLVYCNIKVWKMKFSFSLT